MVSPFYFEFRFRIRELDSKMSAVKDALQLVEEQLYETSRKLDQLERRKSDGGLCSKMDFT